MNAIKSYLDNMFRNLPNTEEVRRAKSELLQMMEDKYEELIADGKSENEAVGIVISEFGNLDELAESLGITEAVTENPDGEKPMLPMERVKAYLNMMSKFSIFMPLGVALCIFSTAMNMLTDLFSLKIALVGIGGMFSLVGVAVVLFVLCGIQRGKFKDIKNKECSLSIESAEYVRNERKGYKSTYSLLASLGIMLCILSVTCPMIFNKLPYLRNEIGTILFFLFIALGVFLIMVPNVRMNAYDRLLELNESGKMSESFVPKEDRKVNKAPIIIASIAVVIIAAVTFTVNAVLPFLGVLVKEKTGETIVVNYDLFGENVNMSGDLNGDIDSVNIKLDVCSVDISTADGSGIVGLDYSGDEKLEPEVELKDGKLFITQKHNGTIKLVGNIASPKLTLVLGSDVKLDELVLDIDAGDVKISDITIDSLSGDFDAGSIEIKKCLIGKLEIDADAGNIEIDDSDINDLMVEADAGNVEINGTTFTNVEANVSLGNIEIHDVENLADYDIDCETDAGMVQVGDFSKGTSCKTRGNGAGSIRAEVSLGNIEIEG